MKSLDKRNAELEKKLETADLSKAVEVLIKDARKRKIQVVVLFISVAFDLLLTIGLTFGYHQNHQLAIKAESNKQAIIHNCETNNAARANNKQLWDYILKFPAQEPITPERQKAIDDFKAFVNKTFEQRDCTKVVDN